MKTVDDGERKWGGTAPWMETFSGNKFHVLDPDPEEIHIVDIAHALSMNCRFTGHCRRFYSVAEHSVHVSRLCKEFPLHALLHDASEAYLADINRPTKKCTALREPYAELEERLMQAVCVRFALGKIPKEVLRYDNLLLGAEARELMSNVDGWTDGIPKIDLRIQCWSPSKAEREFLNRFKELTE